MGCSVDVPPKQRLPSEAYHSKLEMTSSAKSVTLYKCKPICGMFLFPKINLTASGLADGVLADGKFCI
jgi:hypothetical protein